MVFRSQDRVSRMDRHSRVVAPDLIGKIDLQLKSAIALRLIAIDVNETVSLPTQDGE